MKEATYRMSVNREEVGLELLKGSTQLEVRKGGANEQPVREERCPDETASKPSEKCASQRRE